MRTTPFPLCSRTAILAEIDSAHVDDTVWRWLEREVTEVLEIPVAELLDPARHATETWQLDGWPRAAQVSFIRIGEHKLWGLSYRVVRQLLPRLLAGEWAV